ncbi:hypothetical protein ABID97_001085 [Variovorax sp. OAS795]|uniref:ORF6N domain-containing protein n=1 Tax=Variovorax sp. OAS795 TaxID=3034231 RepID=UPI00339238CD
MPLKALNQAVKRNAGRFPPDFMFQLDTAERAEKAEVVTNCGHLSQPKFSRSLPFAFTEFVAAESTEYRKGKLIAPFAQWQTFS